MPSVKEAFAAAKATEAASPKAEATVDPVEKEKTDNVSAIEAQLAEARAEAEKARKEAESLKTESLRIRQDLAENVRLTQSILNKQKTEENVVPEYSDEELQELLTSEPAKYHKIMKTMMKKTADGVAKKYVDDFTRANNELVIQNKHTNVQLARLKLAEKYEGVDEDWDKLVAFGDEYKDYTTNVHNPKHLEAFYLMYKGLNGEVPKKKDGKAISEAFLKKMTGGLNTGLPTDSDSRKTLTPEQKRVASYYGMSDEDYVKYSNPGFTYNDYMATKGGKK